jgi:hypothetical protein
MRVVKRLFAASLFLAMPVTAQDGAQSVVSAPARVPFNVGERLEYDIKFSGVPWNVGRGAMEIAKVDTIRGRETWHTVFSIRGGIPGYRVNDRYESWIDRQTLSSLRYMQDINEGGYHPDRLFEIYPERLVFTLNNQEPQPTVENPLDDGSLLYYLRTVPLRVGMDTSFNRYFKPEVNPIRIRVLRRERIKVPAGEFNAIVVQPMFKSKIFADDGRAEVWLSDDDNRIMLQMKSKVSIGSLSLYLKSYRPTAAPTVKTEKPDTSGR